MTQEEKQLLLEDLRARYRYNNLIVRVTDMNDPSYQKEGKLIDIRYTDIDCNGVPFLFSIENFSILCDITEIKPYLRPMSSMTEEEEKEWQYYKNAIVESCDERLEERISELHDWFNAHYFDYRGLIPMGLALEALEGMYNIN